ncbi:hypothetical protein J1605_004337 [Eschrichtius robustus]|uniref:Uncharacterized protein n=1 Tax=Eschrichtius robustus TaxID=9764 RepID=A0AB34HJW8_ESCRO|nr:hypothetical protein J1605_004337 [Eschrichtius robustus]
MGLRTTALWCPEPGAASRIGELRVSRQGTTVCPPCDNELKSEAIIEHLCASEFGKNVPGRLREVGHPWFLPVRIPGAELSSALLGTLENAALLRNLFPSSAHFNSWPVAHPASFARDGGGLFRAEATAEHLRAFEALQWAGWVMVAIPRLASGELGAWLGGNQAPGSLGRDSMGTTLHSEAMLRHREEKLGKEPNFPLW